MRKCYEQVYVNKFENINERENFPRKNSTDQN